MPMSVDVCIVMMRLFLEVSCGTDVLIWGWSLQMTLVFSCLAISTFAILLVD